MAAVDQATRNEQMMRQWVEEVQNKRNPDMVDEMISPDLVSHPVWYHVIYPKDFGDKPWNELIKENLSRPDPDYENLRTTIDEMFSADDKVVTITTTTGTRNGKEISLKGISITRFEGGKMVEFWSLDDRLGLYQQLGVVPETSELIKQAGLEMP